MLCIRDKIVIDHYISSIINVNSITERIIQFHVMDSDIVGIIS